MAVRIRLKRIGKNPKKRPYFRIAVMDSRRSRDGSFIEELGFYDPLKKNFRIDEKRLRYWLNKAAIPSATVKNLIKKKQKEGRDAAGTNS